MFFGNFLSSEAHLLMNAQSSSVNDWTPSLFVLRFYGPVNPMGHVERGQFT